MRLSGKQHTTLSAAGVFLVATAVFGQTTTPPVQNGNYPNGSTQTVTPGYSGQVSTTGGAQGSINSPDMNANANASGPSMNDRAIDFRFAKLAAIGGLTEVELGKLAVTKASNDKVKQFGQRMVDDHTKSYDELKVLAARNNITLPTDLDAKHKAMINKFSSMSGEQFDKAYVVAISKDHDKDITDFHHEAENGTNDDLKTFATKTLPVLQEHDRMIKEIKSNIK